MDYEWEIDTLKSVIQNMESETTDIEHLVLELDGVISNLEDMCDGSL